MADKKDFLDSFLAHYSSEFYDPVKAHEYYLKTRELSGRNPSDLRTKDQKEGYRYAKSNVDKAKKAETQTVANQRKVETEQLRKTATEKRLEIRGYLQKAIEGVIQNRANVSDKISSNLDTTLKLLEAQKTNKLEKVANDLKTKLDSLPPLPKGSSKEEMAKRAEEVAQIKGAAKSQSNQIRTDSREQTNKLREFTSGLRTSNSEGASALLKSTRGASQNEIDKISSQLKASVDSAKTKYEGLKTALTAKYEAIYQKEFDAIKQNT